MLQLDYLGAGRQLTGQIGVQQGAGPFVAGEQYQLGRALTHVGRHDIGDVLRVLAPSVLDPVLEVRLVPLVATGAMDRVLDMALHRRRRVRTVGHLDVGASAISGDQDVRRLLAALGQEWCQVRQRRHGGQLTLRRLREVALVADPAGAADQDKSVPSGRTVIGLHGLIHRREYVLLGPGIGQLSSQGAPP
jgi:hypothetical protein